MPAKKKTKRTKSASVTGKGKTSSRKKAAAQGAKKSANKKVSRKKSRSRKASARKRRGSVNIERELVQELQKRKASSGGTSARRLTDFEGLPQAEDVDSESVDELVEEGNIFEAGAVAGVEEADDADEREVHTREVSEDDVPEEYLEKD